MTADRRRLWEELLDGISDEHAMGAALHIVSTRSDWPPDVALLRSVALSLAAGELAAPVGAEAWSNALALISGKKVLLTPREQEAMKATGSLYDLKRSTNQTADRARFVAAYDGIAEREKRTREMLPAVAAMNASGGQGPRLASAQERKMIEGEGGS